MSSTVPEPDTSLSSDADPNEASPPLADIPSPVWYDPVTMRARAHPGFDFNTASVTELREAAARFQSSEPLYAWYLTQRAIAAEIGEKHGIVVPLGSSPFFPPLPKSLPKARTRAVHVEGSGGKNSSGDGGKHSPEANGSEKDEGEGSSERWTTRWLREHGQPPPEDRNYHSPPWWLIASSTSLTRDDVHKYVKGFTADDLRNFVTDVKQISEELDETGVKRDEELFRDFVEAVNGWRTERATLADIHNDPLPRLAPYPELFLSYQMISPRRVYFYHTAALDPALRWPSKQQISDIPPQPEESKSDEAYAIAILHCHFGAVAMETEVIRRSRKEALPRAGAGERVAKSDENGIDEAQEGAADDISKGMVRLKVRDTAWDPGKQRPEFEQRS